MTIPDESGTENILLRNKMHQQIHKGRKLFIKFSKNFSSLLENGFSIYIKFMGFNPSMRIKKVTWKLLASTDGIMLTLTSFFMFNFFFFPTMSYPFIQGFLSFSCPLYFPFSFSIFLSMNYSDFKHTLLHLLFR